MEKNRKQIIICAAIVACVCVISVLITYNILQQKNHLTVELYYGTFDFSEYQNVDSTKKLAIIHDNDEKQGEYEMEIEHTDKVETGTWSWNDEGYITLYQDNDAIANLVYVDGKYLFSDADVEIQELKRISETAIVR
ncbi:hypothetical protein [Agathobacter rectalis]|uniref:Uncharacterized protein n=1 Tax=Agathobacter rectalis TaxID=39491 RepID=A0A3E4WWB1_9FIRM|nr:hypothetical protein [Agathobacter rectalis]RGM46528.1 hypothetical protein DXC13_11830 [Agathobacter rectalis]RHF01971.1 hypothetical protein DW703_12190 [Agathobacter rectalis]